MMVTFIEGRPTPEQAGQRAPQRERVGCVDAQKRIARVLRERGDERGRRARRRGPCLSRRSDQLSNPPRVGRCGCRYFRLTQKGKYNSDLNKNCFVVAQRVWNFLEVQQ